MHILTEQLAKSLRDVRQELWVDYCLHMGRTDTDPRPFESKPHIRIIDDALRLVNPSSDPFAGNHTTASGTSFQVWGTGFDWYWCKSDGIYESSEAAYTAAMRNIE